MTDIQQVLVVGSGTMGPQIAMVFARAGIDVHVSDQSQAALDRARSSLDAWAKRAVEKQRMTSSDAADALQRLHWVTDLAPAVDADLVLEAVVEKLEVKHALLAELGARMKPEGVLVSNTSSFVPSRLAAASGRPDRFANLHFFNPALAMACVEIVPGPDTSEDTLQTLSALLRRVGKTEVLVSREIPGFVANRILNAVRDEALFLLEGGYAGVEAIDIACRGALGYPMGPFELMDLTGIDIGYYTKTARFGETGDPRDAPSPTVRALVERGDLGRKTGRGFYFYDRDGNKGGVAWDGAVNDH